MEQTDGLKILLERASQGDETAAEELLQQFGPRILRAVRLRLSHKLRRDYDSTDFVQAVWKSFFENLNGLQVFNDARALCAYLATMAERKVQMSARGRRTLKRDVSREQPWDSALGDSQQPAGSNSTPSEEAIAVETWQHLLRALPLHHQRILYLRTEGFTNTEIAARLGIAEITVRRALDAAKQAVLKSS